jgi:hypothetical protein
MKQVAAACKQLGVGVLVVDTLVEFSDIEDTEENSSGKVKGTLAPMKTLAHDQNIAVVFTQHHNVEGRGRGSTQFEAGVDILLDLRPLESGEDDGEGASNVRKLEGI